MGLPFLIGGGVTLITLGALYAAKSHFETEANEQWKKLTGEETTGWNDAGDAFRHAYVAARFAQHLGPGVVDFLGAAHEMLGNLRGTFYSDSVDPRDNAMDEYNNHVGAEFGAKYDDLSPDDLAKEIKRKTENGELVTDFETDARVQNPNNQPHEKSSVPKFNQDWRDDGYQCLAPWADSNPFRSSKYHQYDPLVLDLDGDGIETVAVSGFSGSLFDHDNDGIRTATGWISKDDGLLVRDLNGNGIIDNGGELFGDNTLLANGQNAAHGYEALAELDSNADGKISADDVAFSLLKVWRDLNQDGISQSDELFQLDQVGIQSLNLQYQNTNQNLNGNTLAQTGSYETADGQTRTMGDIQFASDRLYSGIIFINNLRYTM